MFPPLRFYGVYYLAGYVIECALKACVAKKTKQHDFPNKDLAQHVYTHDLQKLLERAGVAYQLQQEFRNYPALEVKWEVVRDWKEKSRYEVHGRKKAKDMLEAVAGVFECIKKYW